MKALFRHSFLLVLAAMVATMVACSSDDDAASVEQRPDGNEFVSLRLGVAGKIGTPKTNTRAREVEWVDLNATDEEMMNIWVVVVTTGDGSLEKVIACRPTAGLEQEIDEVGQILKGNYTVYSFANISVANVCSFLGLTAPNPIPPIGNMPVDIIGVTGTVNATTVAAKTASINGNLFDPTADDNGFGEKGIPMSNVQTIVETDAIKDLIVVRMLAKMEVQVFNDGEYDVTIHSISLTDITPNVADNLKLLPNLSAAGANTMDFIHKDIQPNLGNVTTGNMTYTPTEGTGTVEATGHKSTDDTKNPVKFTFYVNESAKPVNNASAILGNGSGLFYLSLGIKTGSGEEVVYTHALINQKGSTTTDDDAWDYIARNDYRVIPVILRDWVFRLEPLAFVPIAGYPAVTLSSDAQKATFSTGGPIILKPFVKKRVETDWRDFSDPDVQFVSVTWTNDNGTDVSGEGKIFETPLVYDEQSKCIYGTLNNTLTGGPYKTAVTVTVKLGTNPQYTYSFTCDVILKK